MRKWLLLTALCTAFTLFSHDALCQKVSTLIRNAKVAEQAGKCERAIRLYRQAKRLIVEAQIKAKIQGRIASCSTRLYRGALRQANNAFDKRAYPQALRWYRQAKRYAPRNARAMIAQRITICHNKSQLSGYDAALQKGDCDALLQQLPHLTRTNPSHPALNPRGRSSALSDARRNALARRDFFAAARCTQLLGNDRKALVYYKEHLRTLTPGSEPHARTQKQIAELSAKLAQQPALVRFHSMPLGAQIHLDGRLLPGVTPLELTLKPGTYQVMIVKSGYYTHHKTLVISPGTQRISTTVQLGAVPPVAPTPTTAPSTPAEPPSTATPPTEPPSTTTDPRQRRRRRRY